MIETWNLGPHVNESSVGPSKHDVKQTWTSSTFSTNESAWSEMVTRALSLVCEVALSIQISLLWREGQ